MNTKLKYLIKKLLSKRIISKISKMYLYNSFRGDFKDFKEIEKITTRYDDQTIIKRVEYAYNQSLKSNFINDRDGELTFNKNINFRLINYLNQFNKNNSSNILDLGGSLLNFQRNNKNLILNNNISWFVVDNKKICELGKKLRIRALFFDDLEKALISINKLKKYETTVLCGSVLQYIENLDQIIKICFKYNVKRIIVERQPVLQNMNKRISIQYVPFWISKLKYPVCLYSERSMINHFTKYEFKLVDKFNSFGYPFKGGSYKNFVFKK